jgi:deoxyribodipyrimidine photo-lyase
MITLVWLRQDLRLADNPALYTACRHSSQVILVFIDDPSLTSTSQLGAASRVWLYHNLQALQRSLTPFKQQLIIRQGQALSVLQDLIQATGAQQVLWNRVYEPACLARDTQIKQVLQTQCLVKSFNASLLYEPWQILKADQTPYKVFTPFWKNVLSQGIVQALLPAPTHMPLPATFPISLSLEALGLVPDLPWAQRMMAHWQVGEIAALQRLESFLAHTVQTYSQQRDYPAQDFTSRLSPHLHFGEISPRQIAYYAQAMLAQQPTVTQGIQAFLRELGWREFAYYLLYHFPQTVTQPLDTRFQRFQWNRVEQSVLARWQQGNTGYPIIDAGMRQLWQTGWMHNRVRMLVASFLTKNLLLPWQVGEQWFRDTLVDADLASNVLGWQWTAGCGADAAPYFRLFNPILQSQKFDADGAYIKQWCPELAQRTPQQMHFPRELGEAVMDYPLPMIDFKTSRALALHRFAQIKDSA